jgi:hypothetical protein
MVFQSSVIACGEAVKNGTGSTFDTAAWFAAQTGSSVNAGGMAAVLNGIYTIDTTTPTDASAVDSFFISTDFIGAVKDADNNWTADWTVGLE